MADHEGLRFVQMKVLWTEQYVSHSENHVSIQQVSSLETEITLELDVICMSEHRMQSQDCDCVCLSRDGGSVAEVAGGQLDGQGSSKSVI